MANWKANGVLFLYRFFFDLISLSLREKEKIKHKKGISSISNIFGTALIITSINSSLGAFSLSFSSLITYF